MDTQVQNAPKKTLTKRQMLRLESTFRHAEQLFSKLAQKERTIEQVQSATKARVSKYEQEEKAKDARRLEKLARTHEETFGKLCIVVESIENKSKKRLFTHMLGKYGIRVVAKAVVLLEGHTEEEVCNYLLEKDLGEYVKVTKELRKNPLKEKMPTVPGLRYAGDDGEEEYFTTVKPSGDKPLPSTTRSRLKKAISTTESEKK